MKPTLLFKQLNDVYLLASSSRSFELISLLGGYFGKLEGLHGKGLVLKNCSKKTLVREPVPTELNLVG